MAKHSHWHNIRHQKKKQDKKKAKKYAKHAEAIQQAASEGGGNPKKNTQLKRAIEQAKNDDVPKENIERAIKAGTGELLDEGELEQRIYEGYGPDGVAVIIEAETDNFNRTSSDVKYIFSKHDGSLGESGSVKWQFKNISFVQFKKEQIKDKNWEELQLELADSGVEEILQKKNKIELQGHKKYLQEILDQLKGENIELEESRLKWLPENTVEVTDELEEKIEKLVEELKNQDDVEAVYTNLD